VSLSGLISFVSYIAGIYGRWARITFRRYGVRGVLDSSYRPRRAAMGRGSRFNALGRAHGRWATMPVGDLMARLQMERATA
jgi:hypothetical protein